MGMCPQRAHFPHGAFFRRKFGPPSEVIFGYLLRSNADGGVGMGWVWPADALITHLGADRIGITGWPGFRILWLGLEIFASPGWRRQICSACVFVEHHFVKPGSYHRPRGRTRPGAI